ncbi:MAG: GC-type dockerin domain-anchored protein [Phycisphaerales bacterium]
MRAGLGERGVVLIVSAGLPVAAMAQGDPLAEPWASSQTFASLQSSGTAWQIVGRQVLGGLGGSVAIAGDVNADGVDDVVFGADRVDAGGVARSGEAYVVFGVAGRTPIAASVIGLNGANGFTIRGAAADDQLGRVSGAGDVNGDGIDDILIGAPRADVAGVDSGESYVVFGRRDGFPAVLSPDDLDGTNGFRIQGVSEGDLSGSAVAGVGDLNDDGVDDVIIGAVLVDGPDRSVGAAYVVFGSRDGFDPVVSLAELDGDTGFALSASEVDGRRGYSVAAAGDVNGDGVDDAVVGATYGVRDGTVADGTAYVILGRRDAFPTSISTAQLDGTNGFAIRGANPYDQTGAAVSAAGDLNGDGIDDVAIGSPSGGLLYEGYAYVGFGREVGFPPEIALADLDGSDGFRITGASVYERTGTAVAGGSDVNGDGFEDLVVGAPFQGYYYGCYYCGGYLAGRGAAFIVYGRETPFDATVSLGETSADSIVRIQGIVDSRMGTSLSTGGDFNADGRPDVVLGAPDGLRDGTEGRGAGVVIYGRGAAPCAADLDGDGVLTLFDFLEFQNLFDAGDPTADFDGDGSLTLFDFLAFQNAFDAGCG